MKTILSTVVLSSILTLIACSGDRTIVINDLSKSMEQTVKAKNKNPSNYFFSLKGEADGNFMVNGINLEKGIVDTSFLSDWYADTPTFKYEPGTEKKGS
ncbi:hypothetical protein AAHN97_10090 [Chitinophaga niabensis]|uniref:hypothetical protein n=1 Tax=Chitinophaga niabensis TaxID=536979 RepID=UPI0031B9CEB6